MYHIRNKKKKLKSIKDYEEAHSDPTCEGHMRNAYDAFSECMSTEEAWKEIVYCVEVNEKEARTIQKLLHAGTIERVKRKQEQKIPVIWRKHD